ALGASLYLPVVGSGFPPEQLQLAEDLARVLAPTVITSVLIGLAGAILNAHQHFVVPALSPLVSTTFVIVALVGLSARWGIFAMAGGLVVGTSVELILVGAVAWKWSSPRFDRGVWTPHMAELAARFGATLAGAALMAATVLVD